MAEPFVLGVNDLSTVGLRDVNPDRRAARLCRIAEMGARVVRVLLPWNELQPEEHRVPDAALHGLESYLREAHAAGLRVEPVFFCWRLGERNWLPDWLCYTQPPDPRPRDFYRERNVIRAQRLQLDVVVEALAGHEAVLGWDLGRETSDLAPAPDPDAARSRILWLLEALRKRDETHPVTLTLSRRDFEHDRGFRPSGLSEELDFLSIRASDEGGSGWAAGSDTAGFLSFLARALSRKPILISELALSTSNGNAEKTLENARASGAWGAFAWGGEADVEDGLAAPWAESYRRYAVSSPKRMEPTVRLEVDEEAFYQAPGEGIRVAYESYRKARESEDE